MAFLPRFVELRIYFTYWQFLEDPGNCLADVHVLLGNLVAELHRDPVLQHLCEAAAAASSASFCEASAPPPP